jgi:hypothetical protein
MTQVFIVGFGKFGKMALPRVMRLWPRARIWIVDSNPKALLEEGSHPGIRVLHDGPEFLFRYQEAIKNTDWIIPSLPIHLAWKWLVLNFPGPKKVKPISPPQVLGSDLPFALKMGKGLYLSRASFTCPDNCPSPLRFCFLTKEKRVRPLWQHLTQKKLRQGSLKIIESRQLAPGVGGYPFKELKRIKEEVLRARPPFFIGTSCRCHGVVHGLTW